MAVRLEKFKRVVMHDRELLFSPKNKQNIEKKNRPFAGFLLLTIDLFGSTARKAAERV